ncbi:iron ABC transporter permease [Gordonia spumicola]|uniref:Iron ABC transporter permease n=1 Tax=Gordonia spumicola TaxID=589161 RepID=A0A7I9VDM6_9ACTN|nr:iron ABC transporter permease [Gordonia spumicola]GEE03203.1 iron ABC transporter permease [Gordonia spumicola]
MIVSEVGAPPQLRRGVGRRSAGFVIGLLLLLGGLAASVLLGSGEHLSAVDAWNSLWASSDDLAASSAVARANDIVFSQRIPRTVLGLLAGLALGAAGALVQGHTRNPLADPGMLGVNGGASLGVVLGVFAFGAASPWAYMWFGLAGALIAAAVVFAFAIGGAGASPLTLLLSGIGLSAFLTAATSAIVLSDVRSLDQWTYWNVGATGGRGWDVVGAATPFVVVGLIVAFAGGYFLNILALGDSVARSLGSRVGWIRFSGVAAVAILAGAATAACGPIAFLGLVVPHLARFVTGPDYRLSVPLSALLGACLLLYCDVIGRVLGSPGEMPASVVLAAVGAPVFIMIIRRRKLVAL